MVFSIPVITQGSLQLITHADFPREQSTEVVNQDKAFSKVFELMNENTEVFVHRINAMGKLLTGVILFHNSDF